MINLREIYDEGHAHSHDVGLRAVWDASRLELTQAYELEVKVLESKAAEREAELVKSYESIMADLKSAHEQASLVMLAGFERRFLAFTTKKESLWTRIFKR